MTKLKCWKNQTSKTQKEYGGIQYINTKNDTQASIGVFDFSPKPRNYQVQITSVVEARKGYTNSKVGITKKEAMRSLRKYMKEHDC